MNIIEKQLSPEAEQLLHYLTAKRSESGPGRITPDHPITGANLARKFGYGIRDLQEYVKELRRFGHWIAVNTKAPMGYFMARTSEEIIPTVQSLSRRGKETLSSANGMRATVMEDARRAQIALI